MQLFLKILNGIANSVDPDQTVCICNFVRHFGVQNFRTFTEYNYKIILLTLTPQDYLLVSNYKPSLTHDCLFLSSEHRQTNNLTKSWISSQLTISLKRFFQTLSLEISCKKRGGDAGDRINDFHLAMITSG